MAGTLGGMVYLVASSEKLLEAQVAENELRALNREDVKVIALVEDSELKRIGAKKFQRAQNRGLAMPIFRGDEAAAVYRVARELKLDRLVGGRAAAPS